MADGSGRSWSLRLSTVRYRARESLFVLPAFVMVGGILLALAANAADRALGTDRDLPLTLAMSSNAATWLLSTVAGAMITTVGVVFSLTVVSLQLASSQFSPRVMRSFISDRPSQTVIGLLVATFVYCVLVLPNVSGEATDPAPRVALTLAIVLTLVTVVGIIWHLDHLARRLQVGRIIRDIAAEGEAVVAKLRTKPAGLHPAAEAELMPPQDAVVIPCPKHGWVSQVAMRQLLAAVPSGTTVRLETRVGAYIHAGEPLVTVWPAPPERAHRRLLDAIEVSPSRTMQQDVDFVIRQLVDIGLRALSPAVNDPTTAVEVTLRVGSLMRPILIAPLPPTALRDDTGRVLVRPWDLDHDEYVEHAFDQLRHAAPPQPQVAAALLRVLRMLIGYVEEAGYPERAPALRRQLELLAEELERTPEVSPAELDRLRSLRSEATDPADHSRPHPR